jgi:hypothetical protein
MGGTIVDFKDNERTNIVMRQRKKERKKNRVRTYSWPSLGDSISLLKRGWFKGSSA